MNRYSPWPHAYLTPEEAKGTALYRTVLPDKTVVPGLLRRVYPFQLITTTVAGEQSVLSARYVTSGLRTLLHAMTFSGDVEFWQISVRTASGEILFDTTPVAALINLPFRDGTAQAVITGGPADSLLRPNGLPHQWDPAWLIDGTQALQIDGAPLTAAYVPAGGNRGVLNFAFHVWEVPGTNDARGPTPPKPTFPPRPMVPARLATGTGRVV